MKMTANFYRSVLAACLLALSCFVLANDNALAETTAAAATPLPAHWRFKQLQEPFFGGSIRVAETGSRANKTLLLVHGLGDRGLLDWKNVMLALEEDYHLVTFDLPGFGLSDSTTKQLSPSSYAVLINWIAQQVTDKPYTVVGHSMGAAISLRYVANYPQQVDKLILVDAAGILQRTVYVRYLAELPDTYAWLEPVTSKTHLLDSAISKINRLGDRITGGVLTKIDRLPDPSNSLLQLPQAQRLLYRDRSMFNAALGLVNEDFTEAIRQIETPTHIIWGEKDKVAPLRTGLLLAGQMNNAQLHTIINSGHVPMTERPAEFVALLLYALNTPPKKSFLPTAVQASQDLACLNQQGKTYSGHFRQVRLTNCQYVTLDNVSADSIEINNSSATILNTRVASDNIALTVFNSNLSITNAELMGKVAIFSQNSDVDAAGATFIGSQDPIAVMGENNLYFSISKMQNPTSTTNLHGFSIGRKFELQ